MLSRERHTLKDTDLEKTNISPTGNISKYFQENILFLKFEPRLTPQDPRSPKRPIHTHHVHHAHLANPKHPLHGNTSNDVPASSIELAYRLKMHSSGKIEFSIRREIFLIIFKWWILFLF